MKKYCVLSFSLIALVSSTAFGAEITTRKIASESEIWGGDHIQLNVSVESARFLFDCASGEVGSGWTSDHGKIKAEGTFTMETGGPSRPGQEPRPQLAKYTAKVSGTKMKLTITTESGQQHYRLVKDKSGNLMRCL